MMQEETTPIRRWKRQSIDPPPRLPGRALPAPPARHEYQAEQGGRGIQSAARRFRGTRGGLCGGAEGRPPSDWPAL